MNRVRGGIQQGGQIRKESGGAPAAEISHGHCRTLYQQYVVAVSERAYHHRHRLRMSQEMFHYLVGVRPVTSLG